MALQIITADLIGAGVQVSLNTDKEAFIAAGVVVANTDTASSNLDYAIGSDVGGDTVRLMGTAVANGNTIFLGLQASDSNHKVIVGETGHVVSFSLYAISFLGHDSRVENYGLIEGGGGIEFNGDAGSAPTTLINEGIIRAVSGAIDGHGGEDFRIENAGVIKGGEHSFHSDSSGNAIITNTGRMIGSIQFSSANDIYDGSLGTVRGQISGGGGDDTIAGGDEKNRFQGDAGGDLLTGGASADIFIYVDAGDSTLDPDGRDLITDFSHKSRDIIDFSALISGELDFVGKAHFTGADEIRYQISGKGTTVFVNLDVDAEAEMAIQFAGKIKFVESDFAI